MRVIILNNRRLSGFALIATILLMVLLAIITVGTLSLSVVTLRSGNQDSALARAQANARMALMIAIGEIQKEMGSDQRISANSEILNQSSSKILNGHWTGVWNSWKAGEGESSQHRTIAGVSDEMAPSYFPNRSDHFRRWLVSLDESEARDINSPLNVSLAAKSLPNENDDAIFLVSDGTLGDEVTDQSQYVAARLLDIKDKYSSEVTGRYGWWASDESQKARVMDDSYDTDAAGLTKMDQVYRNQSPASMGTKTIRGLETMNKDAQLASLPSLSTLDLLDGVGEGIRPAQLNFHHVTPHSFQVLADVREGGLKRDLSTLLERPIDISETGDEFMLYRFNNTGEAQVPIQDLGAYYQLYYNDPSWASGRRGGVTLDSSECKFEIKVPNYGNPATREKHLRQYTSLYASPVPVRIQFVLAMASKRLTAAELTMIENIEANPKAEVMNPRPTHKLILGVTPILTLWNPNNVPLVIERGNRQVFKLCTPPFGISWRKYCDNGNVRNNGPFTLNYAMSKNSNSGGVPSMSQPYIMQFKFGESGDVRFEPGEVKIFSFPASAGDTLGDSATAALNAANMYEPQNAWNPGTFFLCSNSATHLPDNKNWPMSHAFRFGGATGSSNMVFSAGSKDRFSVQIDIESKNTFIDSKFNEVPGAGFNFWMSSLDHSESDKTLHFRNYQFISRFGGQGGKDIGYNYLERNPYNWAGPANHQFNGELMKIGFPNQDPVIPFESKTNAIPVSNITGEPKEFMIFSMMAGCEAHSSRLGGYGAGRKMATRPFLHGSTTSAPLIDNVNQTSLYDWGWDWQVDKINSIEEAIQMDPGTGNGFWGSGHTAEAGTTRVVQQYLPVLPPISIAGLSSAHIGGFSLANQPVSGRGDQDVVLVSGQDKMEGDPIRDGDEPGAFQSVTATGAAGLAPHVMQAIGNSYAHPNIPANLANTTYTRKLNIDAPHREIPYVDHSYLANKALWDDFFFSSMFAQPTAFAPLFPENRSLAQVADDFFFGYTPLPNRRMTPYVNNLNDTKLKQLISESNQYVDGLADKIAAHLLVEGAFNINSTSVDSWKVLLTSLKKKPVAYLNESAKAEHLSEGVYVGGGSLRNGIPLKTSDISTSRMNVPQEQWYAGRELSDVEIDELANAIVKQVKLRGPFLSLSEFVNRRLVNGSPLAVKGALQAALDDPSVSINAKFRAANRILDVETETIPFAHPEAAKGPIAYGSSAYVDQADILGHFAEQLAPRGDTFVVRTYGDALDKNGKVIARAWCEAIVQRLPEYVGEDEPHLKQNDSTLSSVSKNFGRKIRITGFRWLNHNEI